MPLWGVRWKYRDEGQPKLFEGYRRRLEQIVSYIGFSIRQSGLASSFDCQANKDRLYLILVGSDTDKLQVELKAYLDLLQLPANSKLAIFDGAAEAPEEFQLTDDNGSKLHPGTNHAAKLMQDSQVEKRGSIFVSS